MEHLQLQTFRQSEYRPCFSGHETFPLRHGWLQKAYDSVAACETPADGARLFRDKESIARFGVGRNMVASMRFWALATEVIVETDEGVVPGWAGDGLLSTGGSDRYLEDDASLWLLHWNICSSPRLTTPYWLFNEFSGAAFLRKELTGELMRLSNARQWARVSETTVERDLQCHIRNYAGGRGSNEVSEAVLAELGLIVPMDRQRSRLGRGTQASLPPAVFGFALEEFWDCIAADQETLSFESAAYAAGSPGRVFLIEPDALLGRLERLEETSGGCLAWSETAGLRQIIRLKRTDREQRIAALFAALGVT
ncbi:DUF4007 family protein [Erythrobacter sp. SCSIO 43205]|uniref:DUF4007 family protein n=1 Tax=Erythrobacter sp. SCSIO 43205 TaxID=2779361 RepID=UPI001CA8A1C1|nr:DUF4007 family protein [Erythrobacter sp. SCSIO 43205]UAB79229.1 DUF4007 family protein [Erythrobacter sp. SCSIO 43205]